MGLPQVPLEVLPAHVAPPRQEHNDLDHGVSLPLAVKYRRGQDSHARAQPVYCVTNCVTTQPDMGTAPRTPTDIAHALTCTFLPVPSPRLLLRDDEVAEPRVGL